MIHFLNLIRWKNLLMIALMQYLIKYALLLPFRESHGVLITLSDFNFFLLVLSTLCIAAGGYIINDIYDVHTDKINKPNKLLINTYISEKTATTLFMLLNIVGVGIGFYLANGIGKSGFFAIFFVASALLYIYSSSLKQIAIVGNVVVSVVVALSILLVGIFELIPAMNADNKTVQTTFINIIKDYAIFAFMINLVREMVKDIEDIDGDHNVGIQTLPVLIGRDRATKITFVVALISIFSIIYYVITYLFKQQVVVGYFLIFVIAPLIYICIKLFNAERKTQYQHISLILKLVMLTGMLSLLLYNFILK
ncbi:geranylgeranylglycerol-phosphate geranylgeranyltransferase [Winogradskyella bathintestinalis]|uniref:Geranylgeranylglycerol-phosphate geranylgeranyltransferase n=1 Tax=Winogradskyella bathintestinalis TaxID=3035208 RepID=A0ABT7ZWN5_9FLAO|nr:geranylgeranylglycerol-phosphate geranylgeranyltransferase [Winogradskyella bathintestinalis]MDN3493346.1 geranylgeranylglycerol-phosphate geranylgeranyltransferase [Winogradskyella bathintestinalis]